MSLIRTNSVRSYVESEASGVRINLRYLKGETDHAVKTNVDAHMSGMPLLSIPSAETNHAMAQRECDCYVRGRETCSGACACRASMKICAVTCNCHGFCCNSLVTMPKLDVRGGALGQELYTKDDLPQQKVAFVVCGQILTEALFHDIALIDPRRCYYGVRVSWPGFTKDVPGEPGEVKFVVDPWSHFSGRLNHSDGPVAELCFCRSSRCRGVIADASSNFMEKSIRHYENERDRLKEYHDDNDKSLHDQIETMDAKTKKILSVGQQLSLTRSLDKNDKLQVACDNITIAIQRATNAMSIARHAKCAERATQYARKLKNLDCNPLKKSLKAPNPSKPVFSQGRVSTGYGWFGQEVDEPIQPLPLSLALASGGSLCYIATKPPWIPSGSQSRGTLNLKQFPPLSLPGSHLPSPRIVRPHHPTPKPLRKLPEDITAWPDSGLLSIYERKKLTAWIEGRISARGSSRGVYPPNGSILFAFWLHTRLRKPDEKKMRTFRRQWSGITTQELLDMFEEESEGRGGMSRRAVHCMLADVLTYTPWKWDLQNKVKLVEDRGEGDRWPLLWMDLLSLPGIVPEFSADRVCGSHRG